MLFFTLLGFGLRLHKLSFQPLWGDEGWSFYFAMQSLPQLLALTAIDILHRAGAREALMAGQVQHRQSEIRHRHQNRMAERRASRGIPSPRSAMILRWIWLVPP